MPDWNETDVQTMVMNPFYAILVHPSFSVGHDVIVSRDQWIKANINLINEMGAEVYLTSLLDLLERGVNLFA